MEIDGTEDLEGVTVKDLLKRMEEAGVALPMEAMKEAGLEASLPPSALMQELEKIEAETKNAEPSNKDHASWAQVAITAFQQCTGSDDETVLRDLLGDLMHWADQQPEDRESFYSAIETATRYYDEEVAEEKITEEE